MPAVAEHREYGRGSGSYRRYGCDGSGTRAGASWNRWRQHRPHRRGTGDRLGQHTHSRRKRRPHRRQCTSRRHNRQPTLDDSVVHTGDNAPVGGTTDRPTLDDSVIHAGDSGHTSDAGDTSGTSDGASDAPPASGGGTDRPTDGATGGTLDGHSDGGKEWDPSQDHPVRSDADYGPGFTRTDDSDVKIDSNYGQPRPDHGTLSDDKLPPRLEDLPRDVRRLVTEPHAPFGRAADGHPYSRAEFEARYVDENGDFRYPDNGGAVKGRRLNFTDVAEFQKHYGDVLDRFGGDG